MTALRWSWLGRVGYRAAWERQEGVRDRILGGDEAGEELLFLEHDPVITLGRSARRQHVLATDEQLAAARIELVDSSRGGDVTAHGPGQLVVYPVVRIPGVLRFVEGVGRAIAAELVDRGVPAEWRRDPAGVWVGDAKIAACGIHVKRRVAVHGFALNVTDEPLALFGRIVPCGLTARVTTMTAQLPGSASVPTMEELAGSLAPRIAAALDREPVRSFSCHHHPDR
jgi:lipoyl(octanoyl) transferase